MPEPELGLKPSNFAEVQSKANFLAEIFHGKVISDTKFSICKGKFSIRLTCHNEHNFYLFASDILSTDLDKTKAKFKEYRLAV